jgi:hypothetical protein
VCENILLRTVKFPRAHVQNHLVEEWVEQVIRNWEVLCGPEWCDDDLGEGGQDGVSRNVLDVSDTPFFGRFYDLVRADFSRLVSRSYIERLPKPSIPP